MEGDAPWRLARIQGHGRLSVRFDRATWHKLPGWSSPPAKDLLATCTGPFREKMVEQDFLDSTAPSAQTSTVSFLWQCLGPWRARSLAAWLEAWRLGDFDHLMPLGAKHRQGLIRSYALGNGVSQVGYRYLLLTLLRATLLYGSGGYGSGQGQRSSSPERQRGKDCFWTGTMCWATSPEAHTTYIGYQLMTSADDQRYATVHILTGLLKSQRHSISRLSRQQTHLLSNRGGPGRA